MSESKVKPVEGAWFDPHYGGVCLGGKRDAANQGDNQLITLGQYKSSLEAIREELIEETKSREVNLQAAKTAEVVALYQEQVRELLDGLQQAKHTLDILWISHHANRTDAAIEKCGGLLTKYAPKKEQNNG